MLKVDPAGNELFGSVTQITISERNNLELLLHANCLVRLEEFSPNEIIWVNESGNQLTWTRAL